MKSVLFPGQGSQRVGMGRGLFERFPDMTRVADEILGYSIAELCLEDPNKTLTQTQCTQPALYVVNAMMGRAHVEDTGVGPAITAGHSVGEYNALLEAGVFSFEDGLRLVQKRGALMSTAPRGSMAAVIGMPPERIQVLLDTSGLGAIDIANLNSDKQTIVSGLVEDIARAAEVFSDAGAMYIPLNVSGAFHSRYMAPIENAFREFLGDFVFTAPKIPVVANVNARPYPAGETAELLARQLVSPVRWQDSILHMFDLGAQDFVEIGPGDVLTKLMKGIQAKHESMLVDAKAFAKPADVPLAEVPVTTPAQIVADWNAGHGIGVAVQVSGFSEVLKTRSEAVLLFGHRPAVYMEGYNGYFALADVEPLATKSR